VLSTVLATGTCSINVLYQLLFLSRLRNFRCLCLFIFFKRLRFTDAASMGAGRPSDPGSAATGGKLHPRGLAAVGHSMKSMLVSTAANGPADWRASKRGGKGHLGCCCKCAALHSGSFHAAAASTEAGLSSCVVEQSSR